MYAGMYVHVYLCMYIGGDELGVGVGKIGLERNRR